MEATLHANTAPLEFVIMYLLPHIWGIGMECCK